jgi:type I restriction enzyme S subunit
MNHTNIPSSWTQRPLGDCGEWVSGGTPSKSEPLYWNGDIPWFSAKSVRDFDLRDSEDRVTRLGAENGTKVVPRGAVLFVVRGMSLANEFRVGVTFREATLNQDLRAIIPASDVNARYLARFLRQSTEVMNRIDNASHGTKRLDSDRLKQIEIPLPPLPEQTRIAEFLDKADTIQQKRRVAMAVNADLVFGVYEDWFGNPIRNPRDWDMKKIEDLCDLVRGSSPRPKGDPRYYGGPVKRLMVEDITRDGRNVTPSIDTLTAEGAKLSRPCLAGTVVMVVSGNVGLTAKLRVDACIHDGFVGFQHLKTKLIRPDFLVLTLEMLKVTHERLKAGAIWQNLTTTQVKTMDIPLPPPSEQERFEEFVAVHDKATLKLSTKEQEEETLFNSLVQRAFRGEL